MHALTPLLAFVGNYVGFLLWSALVRGIAGNALLDGMRPIPADQVAGKLKGVYFWLATPWLLLLGSLDMWLYSSQQIARGWFWLFLGAAVVPLIAGATFSRHLRKTRASTDSARPKSSSERSREE